MRLRVGYIAPLTALLAGFALASCNKDEEVTVLAPGYLPPLALPDSVTVTYGQPLDLGLAPEYRNRRDVVLAVGFAGNPRLRVSAADSLTTLLARAVTVDQTTRRLHVDTGLLYPSSTTSDVNGVRTPRNYLVTLTASSSWGYKPVRSQVKVKVLPAQLDIVELPTADPIPYGYGLYDYLPLRYTVGYAGLNPAGTQLKLDINGRPDGKVSISGQQVVVAADAGDPTKQYEWIYDVQPTLTKDGYRVAYRQMRIVLLPKPKFFFGTYYASQNLTVLENYLVIQLGKAFTSRAPTFNPAKYAGTFSLLSITKDGLPFTDGNRIFSVEAATGKVSVTSNTVLTEGTYSLFVRAQTTIGMPQDTYLTLKMER